MVLQNERLLTKKGQTKDKGEETEREVGEWLDHSIFVIFNIWHIHSREMKKKIAILHKKNKNKIIKHIIEEQKTLFDTNIFLDLAGEK